MEAKVGNPFELQTSTTDASSDPGIIIAAPSTGNNCDEFIASNSIAAKSKGVTEAKQERVGSEPSLSLDGVAKRLLSENFILAALELHTELLESGRELRRLSDYFSNPANFENAAISIRNSVWDHYGNRSGIDSIPRSSSLQTFDSFDDIIPSGSDEAEQQSTDRVAVLEFELRKAHQTINKLRQQLTESSESAKITGYENEPGPNHHDLEQSIAYKNSDSSRTLRCVSPRSSLDQSKPFIKAPIKPFEQRALNFLVHEYLLEHDLKLSAVTLCEEVTDQDFDDWDDIGIDLPRPVDLLTMYREKSHVIPGSLQTQDIGVNTPLELMFDENQKIDEFSIPGIPGPEELLNRLNQENADLMERNILLDEMVQELNKEVETLKLEIQNLSKNSETKSQYIDRTLPPLLFTINQDMQNVHGANEWYPCRKISKQYSNSVSEALFPIQLDVNQRLLTEIHKVSKDMQMDGFVNLVLDALSFVVPNVLLNKRHELLPIILAAALNSSSTKQTEQAITLLFNLVKKPDPEQRQLMLASCMVFAASLGSLRTETELIPLCWEQMNSKYPERRKLVAETCMVLAPYVNPTVLSSLVFSTLQEMFNAEKTEEVQCEILRALTVLSLYIEDEGKFPQLSILVEKATQDPSETVACLAQTFLLPTFAQWALELTKFQQVLELFTKLIEDPVSTRSNQQQINEAQLLACWRSLKSLVTTIFWYVLRSGPFTNDSGANTASQMDLPESSTSHRSCSTLGPCSESLEFMCGSKEQLSSMLLAFDELTAPEWFQTWDEFDYIVKNFIPSLLRGLAKLDPFHDKVLGLAIDFLQALSACFGEPVMNNLIKKQFVCHLTTIPKDDSTTVVMYDLSHSIFPVYVVGVLSERNCVGNVAYQFLRSTVFSHANNPVSEKAIVATFKHMCSRLNEPSSLMELVWELVMSKDTSVKILCAKILGELVPSCNGDAISSRIVPGLITLASDNDLGVRSATLPGFGAALDAAAKLQLPQVEDKIGMQLSALFDDAAVQSNRCLLISLIRTLATSAAGLDSKFREEFLLPRLAVVVAHNQHEQNQADKEAVCCALFEAYSALSCCYMSLKGVTESFLPGIRSLQKDLDPKRAKVVGSIIKDQESKLGLATQAYSQSSSTGSAWESSQADVTPGGGLPDVDLVKNKMMDKFKDIKSRMDQQRGNVNAPGSLFSRKFNVTS